MSAIDFSPEEEELTYSLQWPRRLVLAMDSSPEEEGLTYRLQWPRRLVSAIDMKIPDADHSHWAYRCSLPWHLS